MAERQNTKSESPNTKEAHQTLVGDFQQPGRTWEGARGRRRSGGWTGPTQLRGGWGREG